jgi:hypothetical protein
VRDPFLNTQGEADVLVEVLSQEARRHLYLTPQTSIDKKPRNGSRQNLRITAATIGETITMTTLLLLHLRCPNSLDFVNLVKFRNRQSLAGFRLTKATRRRTAICHQYPQTLSRELQPTQSEIVQIRLHKTMSSVPSQVDMFIPLQRLILHLRGWHHKGIL